MGVNLKCMVILQIFRNTRNLEVFSDPHPVIDLLTNYHDYPSLFILYVIRIISYNVSSSLSMTL